MTSREIPARVGQSRIPERDALEMRAADLSGSVASDTQGTDGNLSAGRALAYLACCALVGLSIAGIARCSAGAVEAVVVRPPTATVSIAPARAERDVKVAVGAGLGIGVAGERDRSATAPTATEYTGTERVVPAELWSAVVAYFPPDQRIKAIQVAHCESRFKADAVGALGERGVFQIHPVHGAVPLQIAAQTQQAARIQAALGWSIWSWG